ncbi:MAG: hypothetical protein ACSHYC_00010 [Alphaproteobacteria bacterium]
MSGSLNRLSDSSVKLPFSKAASSAGQAEKRKRLPPVSVRFSVAQREELERRANGRPLSEYIKNQLFVDSARRSGLRQYSDEQAALAGILRALAASGHARTITEIDCLAKDGDLLLSLESEEALQRAKAAMIATRGDLVKALGLNAEV